MPVPTYEKLQIKFNRNFHGPALFEPDDCVPKPRHKIAIIIPYREDPFQNIREDQLKLFLDRTIPLLKR